MPPPTPHIVILAGPNGAGKSTAAPFVLRDALGVTEFVNADVIARGLAGFDPDSAALLAGRIMLDRLDVLAAARENFAFETTLASRSMAPFLTKHSARGYDVELVFISLANADIAVARVADRVRRGGHDVPESTIRRRFTRGLRNLFELYIPLATRWQVFDNTATRRLRLIAIGERSTETHVQNPIQWNKLQELAR